MVATTDGPLTEGVAAYWRDRRVDGAVYDAVEPSVDAWRGPWAEWHRGCEQPTGARPILRLVGADAS